MINNVALVLTGYGHGFQKGYIWARQKTIMELDIIIRDNRKESKLSIALLDYKRKIQEEIE